jgi:hypothetical protein
LNGTNDSRDEHGRHQSLLSLTSSPCGYQCNKPTSGAGFTEVVDRPESARAALEQVLALLARKRNDVRIFDEHGWRRTPAELCLLAAQEVAMLPDESGLSF